MIVLGQIHNEYLEARSPRVDKPRCEASTLPIIGKQLKNILPPQFMAKNVLYTLNHQATHTRF